jgi:hypothetical protein
MPEKDILKGAVLGADALTLLGEWNSLRFAATATVADSEQAADATVRIASPDLGSRRKAIPVCW